MNVSVVARKIELTDAIRSHVEAAMEQFEKYGMDIIACKAIISEERSDRKAVNAIEFTIQLAGRDTIVIKQNDKDLYAAVDIAVERAKKVLRRYHDKITDKSREIPEKTPSAVPEVYSDVEGDEVVPAALDIDKPVEVEEAVEFLTKTNLMFVVFDDMDNNRRVLYRRKDGKFGLY